MRRLINSVVLILVLLAVAGLCMSPSLADEHDRAYELTRSGKILPLQQILKSQREHLKGKVLEVELERKRGRYVYEILVLDEGGAVWEVYVDAVNGKMIKKERED